MVADKVAPRESQPLSPIPLKDKSNIFLKEVESIYSKETVKNYRWCVALVLHQERRGFKEYNELLEKYSGRKNIRTYLVQVMLFDFFDLLPSMGKLCLFSAYYKISLHNQALVDNIMRACISWGYKRQTVNTVASYVSDFCVYMEKNGVADIHDVTDRMIRDYIVCGKNKDGLHRIGAVLKRYADMFSDKVLAGIASLVPKQTKNRKAYQPMLESERKALEDFLLNPASPLLKRDRAVGLLLLYTGMRNGDVVTLKRQSIDLGAQTITFVQNKTGVCNVLPMLPVVSNAIVDYVRNERPKVDSDLLFLSRRRDPREGYMECSPVNIINSIYDKAGIRQNGVRKGTHLLRHGAADDMINNGTDVSVISGILGHKDPSTTIDYISVNVQQLRACALPIDDYPVKSSLYAE